MIRPLHRGAGSPMLAGAAVFGVGIAAGAWSVGGEVLAAFAGALAVVAAAAFGRRARAYGAVAFLCAGFAWGRARVGVPAEHAALAWSRVDRERPVRLTGVLRDCWTGPGQRRRTRLRAETIEQAGEVRRFPSEVAIFAFGDIPPPGIRGDRVTMTASIDAPDDAASTRDLPSPVRTFRASLKSGWQLSRISRSAASLPASVNDFFARRLFAAPLSRSLVQAPIAALLLGRPGELDDEVAETVREGGLGHLLLATGLHVGIFAATLAALLSSAGVRRRARDLLLMAAIAAFALLSGAGLSVNRVALTLAFLLAARIVELPVSPLQAIGASAITILVFAPEELWRFGFWMTFAAALALARLVPILSRVFRFLPRRLRLTAAVAVAVQLAAAPLLLWRFNRMPAAAWIAAPVAIPAAAVLMGAGLLVLAALGLGLPATVPAAAFEAVFRAIEWAAGRLRGASILAATPPLAAVLLLLALLAGFALAPGARSRAASGVAYAVLLAALLLRGPRSPGLSAFSIEALDVGQGDAFLLRSETSAFLVDGGGGFSGEENFGRVRLLPKLFDRGVRRLDGVLLSHPHPDHGAGLFAVLRDMPVGVFFHGEGEDDGALFARLEGVAAERRVPVRVLRAGDEVPWGGGAFRVLRSGGRPFKKDPINNESVVLLYTKGSRRVLLTGDAGLPAEEELLERLSPLPRVDVLKVGHHGSRTSSGAAFLAALAPRAALLSCGRRNRFHHPSAEALEHLAGAGIPVFRTDLRSDVGIVLTPRHLFLRERGRP